MEVKLHKLHIRKFKGFTPLELNAKIVTEDFLNSSREVVGIFESFGKLFMPIVLDMNNNIKVLDKHLQSDPIGFRYVEDMMLQDMVNKKSQLRLSLLWLKRALDMLEAFFTNIMEDYKNKVASDELKTAIQAAYQKTLLPFHGWILQQTFSMMYRFSPNRSELFGTGAELEDNMQALEEFIVPFRANLKQVHDFYTIHNLHCLKKV